MAILLRAAIVLFTLLLTCPAVYAVRSVIVEAEGSACSKKGDVTPKTEEQAFNNAFNKARSVAADHVTKQAGLKDTKQNSDLEAIYLNAPIRGLQEIKKQKYKEASGRKCVRVLVKAEVTPEENSEKLLRNLIVDESAHPLDVQVWPERQTYQQGEDISFFLKGNKPFFASIVYTDAADNIVQILPNQYRKAAAFEADHTYKLPQEEEFIITVAPPAFGTERITVYAATVPLHEISDVVPTGIDNDAAEPGGTRDSHTTKQSGNKQKVVEYIETSTTLITRKRN